MLDLSWLVGVAVLAVAAHLARPAAVPAAPRGTARAWRVVTADLVVDPQAAAIVRHTVALAHDLGLRLVAEGVEHLGMAQALAALGRDVARGYGVARPMPLEDFRRWLGSTRRGST